MIQASQTVEIMIFKTTTNWNIYYTSYSCQESIKLSTLTRLANIDIIAKESSMALYERRTILSLCYLECAIIYKERQTTFVNRMLV